MPGEERTGFKIELSLCDRTIEATTAIPNAPMRMADLLPVLLSFDSAFVGMAADKSQSDGAQITCRAGCAACCRQLVPISEAEAIYLAELVAGMPAERQEQVRRRFAGAISALGEPLMGRLRDATTASSRPDISQEYFSRGIPCPFLENECCTIYEHRPMSCREHLVTSPAENCKNPTPEPSRPWTSR
jgi:Fe-S-cluster containining protein